MLIEWLLGRPAHLEKILQISRRKFRREYSRHRLNYGGKSHFNIRSSPFQKSTHPRNNITPREIFIENTSFGRKLGGNLLSGKGCRSKLNLGYMTLSSGEASEKTNASEITLKQFRLSFSLLENSLLNDPVPLKKYALREENSFRHFS